VLEFYKTVGRLTDPAAHGGNRRDAFHLVVPSLPELVMTEQPEPGHHRLQAFALTGTKQAAKIKRRSDPSRLAAQFPMGWRHPTVRAIAYAIALCSS